MNNIKIISSASGWIESNAVNLLKRTAELNGVIRTVGLPDLHVSKGAPVGSAVLVSERIYPHIIGGDIGCGMAFYRTGLPLRKFRADSVYERLSSAGRLSDCMHAADDDLPAESGVSDVSGTIGGGNHFAEFQAVDEIFDKDICAHHEIGTSGIYLLVHTGSRGYGHSIIQKYSRYEYFSDGFKHGGPAFADFIYEHDRALKWAEINRDKSASKIMRLSGIKSGISRIIDLPHNYIEAAEFGGRSCFLHRKGAVSSERGLVVIPGSRGSRTYIAMPADDCTESLFSLSHGAGRRWERSGCRSRLAGRYSKKSIRGGNSGSRVVCGDIDVLFEEAPEAYKNIEQVVRDLESAGLIRKVAAMRPLLTFKDVKGEACGYR